MRVPRQRVFPGNGRGGAFSRKENCLCEPWHRPRLPVPGDGADTPDNSQRARSHGCRVWPKPRIEGGGMHYQHNC